MRSLRFAACCLGLSAAFAAYADTAQILLKAADAARTANYRGVVIYRADGSMESLRLIHGFADGLERERLVALTGEPREIIRLNNKITCLLPKERKLDMTRPALKGLLTHVTPESLKELSAWYELRELGTARVAGRNCQGVALAPHDAYRYGFEIWPDEVTGVPLKVALIGPDRRVLEEVMFTEVEFPASLPDQAFTPELDPTRFRAVTRAEPALLESADLGDFPLRFEGLPPGYRVTLRDQRAADENHGRLDHVLISDGLSAISVFAAEGVPPGRVFEGAAQLGALRAYGRSIGRYHVTIVGETPSAAIASVATGLKLNELAPHKP